MPKVIFNGDEGEAFTNDTPKALYQFFASLTNTCGQCLQFHHAISSFWPIPLHRGCRCRQELLKPGATAEPWVDFRKLLDGMSQAQRREAVGASNYRLLKRGVVKWGDVVTDARVRSFREVVAREKLTVPDLTKLGVPERIAKAAWDSTHTTGHQAAAAHRKALIANLGNAGVSPQQIRETFAKGVAAKVTLVKPHATSKPISPGAIEPLVQLLGLDAAKVKAALRKAETPKAAEFKAVPRDEIAAWGEKHYGEWARKLADSERSAIEDYTGSDYGHLNTYLRGQSKYKSHDADRMTADIDRALGIAPIPEDVVVYRGFDLKKYRRDPEAIPGVKSVRDLKVGDDLIDIGFTSTSLDPSAAFRGDVQLEIRVPKGTPGAYVGDVAVKREEHELLLGREVDTFRIVEIKADGRIVVDALMSKDLARDQP